MAESSTHSLLVKLLTEWIANNLLNGDHGHLLVDSPERSPQQKPPKINGFVPDVYMSNSGEHKLIIGEAKTANDIESKHTIDQIKAYIQVCAADRMSMLVLAVPWYCVGTAYSTLNYCKNKTGLSSVNAKIIEKLPG